MESNARYHNITLLQNFNNIKGWVGHNTPTQHQEERGNADKLGEHIGCLCIFYIFSFIFFSYLLLTIEIYKFMKVIDNFFLYR